MQKAKVSAALDLLKAFADFSWAIYHTQDSLKAFPSPSPAFESVPFDRIEPEIGESGFPGRFMASLHGLAV